MALKAARQNPWGWEIGPPCHWWMSCVFDLPGAFVAASQEHTASPSLPAIKSGFQTAVHHINFHRPFTGKQSKPTVLPQALFSLVSAFFLSFPETQIPTSWNLAFSPSPTACSGRIFFFFLPLFALCYRFLFVFQNNLLKFLHLLSNNMQIYVQLFCNSIQ